MSEKYIKQGKFLALISLVIGTIIFAVYFETAKAIYLFIGCGYTVLVGILHLAFFIKIIQLSYNDEKNKTKLRRTAFLLFLNLPILIFYIYFAVVLLSTVRINLKNETKTEITQIFISGCDEIKIESLKANETKTVWVTISSDCSINATYVQNEVMRFDVILGYTTPNMGTKMSYSFKN